MLDHGVIFLVGKADTREQARQKVLALIQQYELTVVAIGNGTACRHTEGFFAELIENDLKSRAWPT